MLGGALTQHLGWRWIFWILAIYSAVCVLLIAIFLPETSRFIVGNGSREVSGIQRTLFSCLRRVGPKRKEEGEIRVCGDSPNHRNPRPVTKYHIPNPLTSLKMLREKDTALITSIHGVYYMLYSCLQASLSPLFIHLYHLSELNAGLIYLPYGIGSVAGGYCSGITSSLGQSPSYRHTVFHTQLLLDDRAIIDRED